MAKTNSTRVKAPANLPAGEALHINCGSHDVGTSNPTGRVATDGGISRGAQFLKCKKPINIATMNTRTLKNPHKQLELCALAKKYRIEVLAIQEHRIVHSDNSELQFEQLPEGFQLITASAYRNKIGASIGGVGILLSSFAKRAMLSVRFITSRILQVTLGGNPKTTIITTYSPTPVSDEEDVEEHYKQLNAATQSVPAHNVLIIAGDFNARIGLDDAKFAYHQNTNRNGDFLLEFAQENNLIITARMN
ncbi:craniofacial development protein 2-like [Amphiura filiformis]|uniref:craniofacial development protein 2-like n=1 Tax=Amphiura filiformis TaxID=82378 RepID=UPI003B216993